MKGSPTGQPTFLPPPDPPLPPLTEGCPANRPEVPAGAFGRWDGGQRRDGTEPRQRPSQGETAGFPPFRGVLRTTPTRCPLCPLPCPPMRSWGAGATSHRAGWKTRLGAIMGVWGAVAGWQRVGGSGATCSGSRHAPHPLDCAQKSGMRARVLETGRTVCRAGKALVTDSTIR